MRTDHSSPVAMGDRVVPPLFTELGAEHAATRRLLARYPDHHGDWRPHPKSRTLSQLGTHVADILNRGVTVLTTEFLELGTRSAPVPLNSAPDLLAAFNAAAERFDAALAAATPERLRAPWSLRRAGHTILERPRAEMIRTLAIHHLVHHRAQLGMYYRLLDVAVPGMYGPSADEETS